MPDMAEKSPPGHNDRTGPLAHLPWILVSVGLLAMFVPSLWDLFHGVWATDEQGHGPIVLGISIWLLYTKRREVLSLPVASRPVLAFFVASGGAALYVIGRSQGILSFEIGAAIWMVVAILLLMRGVTALQTVWFALFFMLFMVPLPSPLVDAVTQPMKLAVSYVTELILYWAGYPVARSGVLLQIGSYKLLVADACAGLHTLFTLEALGLLYLNLVRHASLARNVSLALLIMPISFTSNVIRVMSLTLITYYFGDEAGQGFLHKFAGLVLFMVALLLILATDSLIRSFVAWRETRKQRGQNDAHRVEEPV